MATLTPLRYPGGKDKTYKYIQHLIQTNGVTSYVEPFAGGAAVAVRLLLNGDVNNIIINDFDKSIYAFWYSILNHSDEFISLINETEINMEEWFKQKNIQLDKNNSDLLSLGFSTFFLNRTNRSGIIKAGVIGGKNQDGKNRMDCRFNKLKLIQRIESICERKNDIELYNLDAEVLIKDIISNRQDTLTFFDPPYYHKGPDLYTNFFQHQDHVNLARTIERTMEKNYWILTYDLAAAIEELYEEYFTIKYSLNYSIAKPSKGQEFMFFSAKTNPGRFNEFLKIIN